MSDYTDIWLVNGERIRVKDGPETHDYLQHTAGTHAKPIELYMHSPDFLDGRSVWISPVHVVAFW